MLTLATHIGPRPSNEDAARAVYLPRVGVVVAAVADGVGSRAYGAAGRAIDGAISSLRRAQRGLTGIPRTMAPLMYRALSAADCATRHGDTTLVLAVIGAGWASVLHVGDSCAWTDQTGALRPITQPHGIGRYVLSTVADVRRMDLLYMEAREPYRLVLTTDGIAEPRGMTAADMVAAQMATGPHDNATALVAHLYPDRLDSEIGDLVTL